MQQTVRERLPTEYGSFGVRLGGFIIDSIGVGFVSLVLSLVAGNVLGFLGLAIGLAYYVGFNANGGTLGKRAVGLRLENEKTGEDLGYGAALVRYIVAIASAFALLIGYLWVIWDGKNQTWHDKAAGSVVVSVQQAGGTRAASGSPAVAPHDYRGSSDTGLCEVCGKAQHDKGAGSVVVGQRTKSALRRQSEAALDDLDARKPTQETKE